MLSLPTGQRKGYKRLCSNPNPNSQTYVYRGEREYKLYNTSLSLRMNEMSPSFAYENRPMYVSSGKIFSECGMLQLYLGMLKQNDLSLSIKALFLHKLSQISKIYWLNLWMLWNPSGNPKGETWEIKIRRTLIWDNAFPQFWRQIGVLWHSLQAKHHRN